MITRNAGTRIEIAKLRTFVGWCTVFFAINLPPFELAYFMMSREAFQSFSLNYLGVVSIIALVAGFGSWWQSLQVQEHQEQDADVQEVLDLVKETNGGSTSNPAHE